MMIVEPISEPQYYVKKKGGSKGKRYEKIARNIDKIIDIIIDEFSDRYKNNNGKFTFYTRNNNFVQLEYSTNVYGDQPRYEAEIGEHLDECRSRLNFKYYHGEVFRNTSSLNMTNTFVNELNIKQLNNFTDAISWLMNHSNIDTKAKENLHNCISKIINEKLKLYKLKYLPELPNLPDKNKKKWYQFWK